MHHPHMSYTGPYIRYYRNNTGLLYSLRLHLSSSSLLLISLTSFYITPNWWLLVMNFFTNDSEYLTGFYNATITGIHSITNVELWSSRRPTLRWAFQRLIYYTIVFTVVMAVFCSFHSENTICAYQSLRFGRLEALWSSFLWSPSDRSPIKFNFISRIFTLPFPL